MEEDFKAFLEAVREMRKYQKKYFKTKDANAYVKARALELIVDNKVIELTRKQEELFQ